MGDVETPVGQRGESVVEVLSGAGLEDPALLEGAAGENFHADLCTKWAAKEAAAAGAEGEIYGSEAMGAGYPFTPLYRP